MWDMLWFVSFRPDYLVLRGITVFLFCFWIMGYMIVHVDVDWIAEWINV